MALLSTMVLAAAALAAAAAPADAAQAAKPSILHVVADDLGYFDLGYKNKRTHSPTIDALATGGIQLSSYYVMVVCSCVLPARRLAPRSALAGLPAARRALALPGCGRRWALGAGRRGAA